MKANKHLLNICRHCNKFRSWIDLEYSFTIGDLLRENSTTFYSTHSPVPKLRCKNLDCMKTRNKKNEVAVS
jgi:hypothetical protein